MRLYLINEGSDYELKMHAEAAFHPTLCPDYFALLCLREDQKYKFKHNRKSPSMQEGSADLHS
jgi:hypothetical protein